MVRLYVLKPQIEEMQIIIPLVLISFFSKKFIVLIVEKNFHLDFFSNLVFFSFPGFTDLLFPTLHIRISKLLFFYLKILNLYILLRHIKKV